MDGLIAYALAKKYSDSHSGTTISGSSAPTSTTVAKAGDFYRDTTTNKLYQCTQYVDPSTTTDLTGITLTLNDNLHDGLYDLVDGAIGQTAKSILFTSNGNNYVYFNIWYNSYSNSFAISYGDSNYPYKEYEGYWVLPDYKTITITGGTDATDPDVINFFITYSNIGGATWVEIAAKDARLPETTSADEGKMPVVDSNGSFTLGSAGGITTDLLAEKTNYSLQAGTNSITLAHPYDDYKLLVFNFYYSGNSSNYTDTLFCATTRTGQYDDNMVRTNISQVNGFRFNYESSDKVTCGFTGTAGTVSTLKIYGVK